MKPSAIAHDFHYPIWPQKTGLISILGPCTCSHCENLLITLDYNKSIEHDSQLLSCVADFSSVEIDVNPLTQDYCREAGVRNLKNQLEKIYRKAALKLVKSGAKGPANPESEVPATSGEASDQQKENTAKEDVKKGEEEKKHESISDTSNDEITSGPAKDETPQKVDFDTSSGAVVKFASFFFLGLCVCVCWGGGGGGGGRNDH